MKRGREREREDEKDRNRNTLFGPKAQRWDQYGHSGQAEEGGKKEIK